MIESDVCPSGINEAKRSPEEQNNLSDSGLNSIPPYLENLYKALENDDRLVYMPYRRYGLTTLYKKLFSK